MSYLSPQISKCQLMKAQIQDLNNTETLKVSRGNFIRFEIDTRARCNVLPIHIYEKATGDCDVLRQACLPLYPSMAEVIQC